MFQLFISHPVIVSTVYIPPELLLYPDNFSRKNKIFSKKILKKCNAICPFRQVNKSEGASLATEYDSVFYETTAAEEYDFVERVFHRIIQETHHDKYGHLLQQVCIADDRASMWAGPQHQPMQHHHQQFSHLQHRRPKSPKGLSERKDERNQQKKTLNKFFKIFN